MKYKLSLLAFFISSQVYAVACLKRPDDLQQPLLNVISINSNDLAQPITIDTAYTTQDCTTNACTFRKDDTFSFDWNSKILTWISGGSSSKLNMRVVDDAKGKVVYLKSLASNGYIYYLLKTGVKKCELIERYKGTDQSFYHGKNCTIYRVEAFEQNPSLAHQKIYVEPDDSDKREPTPDNKQEYRVEWAAPCSTFTQPGGGGGIEPPP